MTLKEKVVSLVSRRSPDLRSELDRAQRELVAAEAAYAADSTDALWRVVEKARQHREQLDVKVRAAERREREEADREAAAEAERKRREMTEAIDGYSSSAVADAVAALAPRVAKIVGELIEIDRERAAIAARAVESAARAQNLARELGDATAEAHAERATMKLHTYTAQTYASISAAVTAAHPSDASAVLLAARLVDPLWRAG